MNEGRSCLSERTLTALEGAVTDACFDAMRAIPRYKHTARQSSNTGDLDVSTVILDVVHRALAAFAVIQNENALVMRLPAELLCTIFTLVPLRSRIAASHVCRTFRDTLLANPSTWGSFEYKDMKDGVLTRLLRRSGSANLELDVSATRANYAEVAAGLEMHLHRCTRLYLVLDQRLRSKSAQRLLRALSTPAANLRSFQLHDRLHNLSRAQEPSVELFGNQSPRLGLVKMHADLATLPPWSMGGDAQQILFCGSWGFSYSTLESLIDRAQTCRGLGIEVDCWMEEPFVLQPGTLTVPECIKELVVILNTSAVEPSTILRHLDISSTPRVQVTFNLVPPAEFGPDVLRLLSRDISVRSMRINSSTIGNTIVVDMWDSADGTSPKLHRVAQNIDSSSLHLHSHSLFAHLTHLSIGELIMALLEAPLPILPALTELTLQTLAPDYYASDGHASVFLLPRTRDTILRCPVLRTLRVGARYHGGVTRLAPEMIWDFVVFHLQFDAPRLPRLVICGLQIVENVPLCASALLDLAESFEVEEGFLAEPPRPEDIMDWD